MEESRVRAALEAILFTTGKAVKLSDIAKVLDLETDAVREAAVSLKEQYEKEDRGIRIIELEDSLQMCTNPEFYEELIRLELQPKKPKISEVQLETLSVIAYKQPVTKSEIERIRGVNSDHAVNRLIEYGLVKELGRARLPGRPVLFGTTEEFLAAPRMVRSTFHFARLRSAGGVYLSGGLKPATETSRILTYPPLIEAGVFPTEIKASCGSLKNAQRK